MTYTYAVARMHDGALKVVEEITDDTSLSAQEVLDWWNNENDGRAVPTSKYFLVRRPVVAWERV